jgi:hypothetical protein
MPNPVSAVVGGATAVGSSLIGSNASKKAAKTQTQAASRANAEEARQFDLSREDILKEREKAQKDILEQRGIGRQDILQGRDLGLGALRQGTETARGYQQPYYQTGTAANNELGRLLGLDSSQSASSGYGGLAKPFGMDDYQADPGYAFRMAEGQKALDRASASRGKYFSGEAIKGLTRYNQDAASQEYQNAYNRYNQNQQNLYSRLAGTASTGQAAGNNLSNLATGLGQQEAGLYSGTGTTLANQGANSAANYATTGTGSANQLGQLGQANAQSMSKNITDAGNSQAAGQIGSASAWQTGLNNIGSNFLYSYDRPSGRTITTMPWLEQGNVKPGGGYY